MKVSVVNRISAPANDISSNYLFNRVPLRLNPLAKLPVGAVRARGWLRKQLELMTEGVTGRLDEISKFLKDDNGWLGGEFGAWEEQPYWLRGFHDLAILTGNDRCRRIADKWLEAVIRSQESDGYFGTKSKSGENEKAVYDIWPHMVMLDTIANRYEYTSDERYLNLMERFFAFCMKLSDHELIPPVHIDSGALYVQHYRAGEILPHLFWLYNHTGEKWLLDLAHRFYARIAEPEDEWLDHHGVNFAQRFSYPGIYYQLSQDRRHLELTNYWYT
ncbi:MAG: beta-L-arabinofuranosidase domain-containing protein, partial [Victivallaceae bacterium]